MRDEARSARSVGATSIRTRHRADRTIRCSDEGSWCVHHDHQDRPLSSRVAPGSSRPLGDTVRDIALADALEAGRDVSVDDLVFTNDTEAKIRGCPSSSRADGNVCAKRAGLEHVKLHGLRHSSPPNSSPAASTYVPCRTGSATPAPPRLSTSTGHGSQPKTKQPLNTSTPCSTRPKRLAESVPRLSRSARIISC